MTVWFDVEDLFDYARHMARPSGIQRLSYELYAALHKADPSGVGFVRHDRPAGTMRVVEWPEIEALYTSMTRTSAPREAKAVIDRAPVALSSLPGLQTLAARLPREVAAPLGEAARSQIAVIRALLRATVAVPGAFRRRRATPQDTAEGQAVEAHACHADLRDLARPGDVLAAFGSPWAFADYPETVVRLTQGRQMRFAMLVYDLIPVIRPEFCDRGLVAVFERFVRGCLPLADTVLAISEASVRDIVTWSAREGIALRSRPRAIPIGSGFSDRAPAPALPQGLVAGGYALFVSTIEARKNHALAFHAWRRLLDEIPREQVPTLVFAGRVGWMVADLMQQIQNARHLGGKLVIVENPDDAILSALYRGARFTLFPSLYEGWGLPVSESLSFGKVCLASSRTSVPEAGGSFCLYHDPESVTEAVALYRRALTEPGLIEGLEAQIRDAHRPIPWSDAAHAVLDALRVA